MSKNRFEQWINNPIKLLKNVDPTIKRLYQDPTTEFAWLAWQKQQKVIDEYVIVAESLDESYSRECKKNKALQKRIESLESMLFN